MQDRRVNCRDVPDVGFQLLVFIYPDDKMSLTGELSNELLYKFPDKVIIVGRKKNEEVKMSIRSKNIVISSILEKALIGLEGYGGGHECACGANVKEIDLNLLKRMILGLIICAK